MRYQRRSIWRGGDNHAAIAPKRGGHQRSRPWQRRETGRPVVRRRIVGLDSVGWLTLPSAAAERVELAVHRSDDREEAASRWQRRETGRPGIRGRVVRLHQVKIPLAVVAANSVEPPITAPGKADSRAGS